MAASSRSPDQFNAPTVRLEPQARLVDTYVRPPEPKVQQLADALAKIDAPLKRFMASRKQKQEDNDLVLGEAAFWKNHADGDAEAVRSGRAPAQGSRAFMKGYKGAQGSYLGNQMLSEFDQAYLQWEGKGGSDPEALDKFVGQFIAERLNTNDPDVLRQLLPHVRTLSDRAFALDTQWRHEETYNGSLNSNVAVAGQAVDAAVDQGAGDPAGVDYPAVFKAIEERRTAFIASGGKADDFDKTMIDAMSTKIQLSGDEGLLAWFDQKVPGKDYTYGESPYGAPVLLRTKNALDTDKRQLTADEARKAKAEFDAAKDASQLAVVDFLAANPGKPVPEDLIKEYSRYEPKARVNVREWSNTLSAGITDPERERAVYEEIIAGGGLKAVTEAFQQGVFGKREDFTAAYNFAKQYETNRAKIEEAVGSASFKRIMTTIDTRTKAVSELGDQLQGTSDEGLEAQYDFRRLVMDWVNNHPDATLTETEEAVAVLGRKLLEQIPEQEGFGAGGAEYNRPPDIQKRFTNPYSPTSQQPYVPSPEEEAFVNDLDDTQRADFEQRAASAGLTVHQLAGQMLDAADGPAPETQQAPATEAPAQQSQSPTPSPEGTARDTEGTPPQRGGLLGRIWDAVTGGGGGAPAQQPQSPEPGGPASPEEEIGGGDPANLAEPGASSDEDFKKALDDIIERNDNMLKQEEKTGEPKPRADLKLTPAQASEFLNGVITASYSPGSGGRRAVAVPASVLPPGPGLGKLVTSTKRGYKPDIEHLKPAVRQGMETLQASWGRPIPIVSGYRDPARNARAGGAKKSQHMHGNAVDLDVSNLSPDERVNLIRLASAQGWTGIGVYANSLHLDYGGRRYWGPSHSRGSEPQWARAVLKEHMQGTAKATNVQVAVATPTKRPDGFTPEGSYEYLPAAYQAVRPPQSVFDKGFSQEDAMAFLDEALAENPMDLEFDGSTRIAGDDVASRLGNVIGNGEANGNYNAVAGNSASKVELSKFTLDDILARQASAIRRGKFSAIGKYQIKFSTLRGLKRELGLSGGERFTVELQDQLFYALLHRRGYEQWRSGEMSNQQFALRLSQEWAALENPETGRSYYAGDGHNKARVSSADVYAALGVI